MFCFSVIKPVTSNYTPAGIIYEYAKHRNYETYYYYDITVIIINGIKYCYDHWKIKNLGNGTEQTNIYLKKFIH